MPDGAQGSANQYEVEVDPGVKCTVWLPPPFSVPIHMEINNKTLKAMFGRTRFDVVMAYPPPQKDPRYPGRLHAINLRSLVGRGWVFVWTTPEDLEETLKWYRKHETQVIEVLVSATKSERPRMRPKVNLAPSYESTRCV